MAQRDIDAAIVDVSLGKDNSYPLADALIARGMPFALTPDTGRRASSLSTARIRRSGSRSNFATFRRVIDELLAASVASEALETPRDPTYLSDALIASSAFEPGQSSRSESSLSGRSVVPRTSCSSSASSLT